METGLHIHWVEFYGMPVIEQALGFLSSQSIKSSVREKQEEINL